MASFLSPNSETVRKAANNSATSTQLHLRIAEIRDNTVVLKTGGLRSVLKVSSLNFNLKSEQEQNAIMYSYQSFLNTLEFPVQILIRSRKLDLDKYIEKMHNIANKQQNALLQKQTNDYIDYVQRLIEYADIMEKEFYCVVPVDPPRAQGKTFIQKFWDRMHPADTVQSIMYRHKEFDDLKKTLNQRVTTVSTGLEGCGLKTQELTTSELIAMYYQIYNPLTSRNQKVDETKVNLKVDSGI